MAFFRNRHQSRMGALFLGGREAKKVRTNELLVVFLFFVSSSGVLFDILN